MLNRKNVITILLVVALIAVVYFSMSNRSQHGDPNKWIQEHGKVAARHADINKFCVDCHYKKMNQTKDNFCNKCHQERNVKLIK